MPNPESEEIPNEEMINYVPTYQVAQLLRGLELDLKNSYDRWSAVRAKEMSTDPALLKEFITADEEVVKVSDLKPGDAFILVSGYPRTKENEKHYVVEAIRTKKVRKRKVRYLVTTTTVHFNLDTYVVRKISQ